MRSSFQLSWLLLDFNLLLKPQNYNQTHQDSSVRLCYLTHNELWWTQSQLFLMQMTSIWLNLLKTSQTQHKEEFLRPPGMMIIQVISTSIIEFMSNAMTNLSILIDMAHINSIRQTQRTTPTQLPILLTSLLRMLRLYSRSTYTRHSWLQSLVRILHTMSLHHHSLFFTLSNSARKQPSHLTSHSWYQSAWLWFLVSWFLTSFKKESNNLSIFSWFQEWVFLDTGLLTF